jgi:hypothetical protein
MIIGFVAGSEQGRRTGGPTEFSASLENDVGPKN